MFLTEEEESTPFDAEGGESDVEEDEISAPPAGNTEGDSIPMTKAQVKEARGMCVHWLTHTGVMRNFQDSCIILTVISLICPNTHV